MLFDKHGNVIDGLHRLAADDNWPKIRLKSVDSEEDRLVARLVSNVCRRYVPAKEKASILERLGEIYLKKGVRPGETAGKIAEKTGMSYTWVMKYLPDKFKNSVKSKSASVTRRVAKRNPDPHMITTEFEEPPKGALTIRSYGNTNFVNIALDKKIYKQLEERAEKLKIPTNKLIYNAILLTLKAFNREN